MTEDLETLLSGDEPRSVDDLVILTGAVFSKAGVPAKTARRVAEMLVDAEARGIRSHGLTRIKSYVDRVRAGLIAVEATPHITRSSGVTLLIDGRNAFGVIAADLAVAEVGARARANGLAWATAIHTNHVGALGYFVRDLARDGLVAMMWSNAAPSVSAYGGNGPILGTNPIAMAAPAAPDPVVLDMATSAIARGKIRRALHEGRAIPEGWAQDADGVSTTDPAAALAGSILPLGGPKGFGLSVFVEVLSGVLGGGASLDAIQNTDAITDPADISFSLMALDPTCFGDAAEFAVRLNWFRDRLRQTGDVLMPGAPEDAAFAAAQAGGVTVAPDVMAVIRSELTGAVQ